MGSMSDEAALNRSAEWAQEEIDAVVKCIKDAPDGFLGIRVHVERGSVWLKFDLCSEEIDIEIIADPDRAELHLE